MICSVESNGSVRPVPPLRQHLGQEGDGAGIGVCLAAGAEGNVPDVRAFVGRIAPAAGRGGVSDSQVKNFGYKAQVK